ncbi:MAG: hypothetical protein KBT68_06775 [bacterium]|nr:hypothetical protein [Candidatus Colisoma equi]
MNLKLSVAGLFALAVSGVTALAETSQYADEIDITAAVREVGAAKTKLESGELAGNTIDNAFGCGETSGDRILLKGVANSIDWTIADSFRSGQPIIVTSYTIKRTSVASGTADPYGQQRAPSQFYLQGSLDGESWADIDYRQNVDWLGCDDLEKTFEIDPIHMASYRKYRFKTVWSNAASTDGAKISFQYIRLNGSIGGEMPAALKSARIDYVDNEGAACAQVGNYIPTLDSRLELDISFNKVTGAQCIFAAKDRQDSASHFRLFHTESGWLFFYGAQKDQSNFKACAGVRYKVIVDGPIVTVNGVVVCNAGDKLTRSTNDKLRLCHNVADDTSDSKLYNVADLKIWSVKAWDGNGNPTLDLQPMLHRDGTGIFYDSVGKFCYQSFCKSNRLPVAFCVEPGEHEITEKVRAAGAQAVTLVDGQSAESFGAENLFNGDDTSAAGRAIFNEYKNTIQYDIADAYLPGSPVVVTRYALLSAVGSGGDWATAFNRAPIQFELKASADGQTWVTLHKLMEGVGDQNYKVGDYLMFNIPEDKRGNYRHYQFLTYKSTMGINENWKTSLQAIKFYGHEGGVDSRCEPVECVQNGLVNGAETKEDGTRFLTGVKPSKADFTVELKGLFTRTDVTECIFCCRGSGSANPWVLFLNNGKFYLVCGSANKTFDFPVKVDTPYVITVKGDMLFVDGNPIGSVDASTDFAPGSEMVLLASHNGLFGWDNQARFKLMTCRILDSVGGVVRDYIPAVRTSDNVGGLFDRVNAKFLAAEGPQPRVGASVDTDFRQGGRSLVLENEPAEKEQLPASLEFAFGENQILPEGLFAAFDNERHTGTSSSDWAKVVKLTDVTSGIKSFTVEKLLNAEHYKYVKFFLGDDLGYGRASTKTFKARNMGLFIVVR